MHTETSRLIGLLSKNSYPKCFGTTNFVRFSGEGASWFRFCFELHNRYISAHYGTSLNDVKSFKTTNFDRFHCPKFRSSYIYVICGSLSMSYDGMS